MNKAIKSSEVILKITEKIELKKQLRDARASKDTKEIENLQRLSVAYNLEFNAVLKTIRLFTKIDSREAFLKASRNLKQVVIDEAIEGLPKTLKVLKKEALQDMVCLLYTSPSPRDRQKSRMPSSA